MHIIVNDQTSSESRISFNNAGDLIKYLSGLGSKCEIIISEEN